MIKSLILTGLGVVFALTSMAQKPEDVLGKWKTIDDETGEAKSIVLLYMDGDKMRGKVVEILNPDKQDAKCNECEDHNKDKPIMGMVIVNDMEWDDDEWDDGTILDPNKGTYYDCKMWLDEEEPNKLNVRGYIAFLYRTQYWYRIQ